MATNATMTAGGFLDGVFASGGILTTSAVSNPTIIVNQNTTFGGLVTHAGGVTFQPENGNTTFALPNATFAGVISIKGSPRSVVRNAAGNQVAEGIGGV